MGRSADAYQDEQDARQEAQETHEAYEAWRAENLVTVYHQNRLDDGFTAVAYVDTTDMANTPETRLEFAWKRTNNIEGSWSQGATFSDGVKNEDYSDRVQVLVPLHEHEGQVFGRRSSMTGDVFSLGDKWYVVASFGFNQISKPSDIAEEEAAAQEEADHYTRENRL